MKITPVKHCLIIDRLLLIIVISITILSCSKYSPNIENTLHVAGPNKKELKKVLNTYDRKVVDSLKYLAACYLIDNLKWHYGTSSDINSDELMRYFLSEDSMVTDYRRRNSEKSGKVLFGYKKNDKKEFLKPFFNDSLSNNQLISDIKNIDAEFLINVIETSFKTINKPWNTHLSFEEFCEHILPYRLNSEPVFDMRKKLHNHYINHTNIDSLNKSTDKIIYYFNVQMHKLYWDWNDLDNGFKDNGFYNVLYWNMKSLNCSNLIAAQGQVLRSVGIPVIEIFTPKWEDSNLGHGWCAFLDNNHNYVLLGAIYSWPNNFKPIVDPDMATTFFAKTYKANKNCPFFNKSKNEKLPSIFNTPCIKNVSNMFKETSNFEVPVHTYEDNKIVYFCPFLNGKWVPVSWGVINRDNQTACFQKVPINLIGIPCNFVNGVMEPCGPLIQILHNNNYSIIKPNNFTGMLKLYRKFPYKKRMRDFNVGLIGANIEGANLSDFSDADILSTVSDTLMPYFQDVKFNNKSKFKYYRIIANDYKSNIAEIQFLVSKNLRGLEKASPLPVFYNSQNDDNVYCLKEQFISENNDLKAFDKDPLTFTDSKWVGIALDKPLAINTIRIMPRNADNGIKVGNQYELLYWDGEWKRHNTKKATHNFVVFKQVPLNTFYWLRNLDRGNEEQPFFYKNGKQVFVNNDLCNTFK